MKGLNQFVKFIKEKSYKGNSHSYLYKLYELYKLYKLSSWKNAHTKTSR